MILGEEISLSVLKKSINERHNYQAKFFDYEYADEELEKNIALYELVKSGKASYNDVQEALNIITNPQL